MGLSISPGKAKWSYGGFARFRERLAALEGLDLKEMKGFGGKRKWETSNGDPITILQPLLDHSDCEGYLDWYECEQMLPRLKVILKEWPDADDPGGHDRRQLANLIVGLEHSVEHGCSVRFS